MATNETQNSPWERNFTEQMVRLRKAQEVTQTDLAKRLRERGLAFQQQTIQKIESGERPVRLNEAHLIADELDVSLESMTATSPSGASASLRFAVEGLRRVALRAPLDVAEALEDVERHSDYVFIELQELLDGPSATLRDIAWAGAWLGMVFAAQDTIFSGVDTLTRAGSARGNWIDEALTFEPRLTNVMALIGRADERLAGLDLALSSVRLQDLDGSLLWNLYTDTDAVTVEQLSPTMNSVEAATVIAFFKAQADDLDQEAP